MTENKKLSDDEIKRLKELKELTINSLKYIKSFNKKDEFINSHIELFERVNSSDIKLIKAIDKILEDNK